MIYFLAEKVSKRLIEQGYEAKTIGISIKTNKLVHFHKSHTVLPCNEAKEIAEHALNILDTFWKYDTPIRAARVRASNLQKEEGKQLNMFNEPNALSKTIEKINKKYGRIALASDLTDYINNAKNPHE